MRVLTRINLILENREINSMSIDHSSQRLCHLQNNQSGFTLLEILIALAIVSILAMVTIPTYQDYSIRAKIAGEMTLAEPVKKMITETFQVKGTWPTSNSEALVNAPGDYSGDYLLSVTVGSNPVPGSLTLLYDNTKLPTLGTNNSIILYPNVSGGGSISWNCDQGSMAIKYRPKTCQ